MSVAKVTNVKHARQRRDKVTKEALPNLKCEKCHAEIKAGDPYRWYIVGFRSRHKHVRCMESGCTPKPSERESSALAGPMAAVEDFTDSKFESLDDLQEGFEEAKATFEEYASECESALDGWPNGNSQLEERVEAANEAVNTCEWDANEFESEEADWDEEDAGQTFAEALAEHIVEQHNEAIDVLNEAESSLG